MRFVVTGAIALAVAFGAAPAAFASPDTGQSGQSGSDVYYKNCSAARAAGAAPILQGQPGYRAALDRDGDGVACE
jgi:hypothetical protein